MPGNEAFFDTNILLYLLSSETLKADTAEALLAGGGSISIQVLNEFASVATRKLHMCWDETREVLSLIRSLCQTIPVTLETHDKGLDLAERYGFPIYDSMIVAAALIAGCATLYTEDLQNGQRIENQLTICNPFWISAETGRLTPSPNGSSHR